MSITDREKTAAREQFSSLTPFDQSLALFYNPKHPILG
jgi:hypothetical protein